MLVAGAADSSAVLVFLADSSSSISAFVRFLPFPFPFVVAAAGAASVGASVDLDDDAGYGIDGAGTSRIAAVRATAASHSAG